MQRKRGSDHADWYFLTCITKNRIGAEYCTGMYVREEDIFNAACHQLKLFVDEHFISVPQYKHQIRQFETQIEQAARCQYEASENFRLCYEGLVQGEKGIEDLQKARDIANDSIGCFAIRRATVKAFFGFRSIFCTRGRKYVR